MNKVRNLPFRIDFTERTFRFGRSHCRLGISSPAQDGSYAVRRKIFRYQRRRRPPASAPSSETAPTASPCQSATNNNESSGQCSV